MTKFSNKLKKPCFWSILGPFSQFWGKKIPQKIRLCHAQLHMSFQHHAKFQKKLMIQFQENAWTKGQTEEQNDGRTDRPYFIGPFRLPPGVQIMMKLFLEREMSHDQNLTSNSPSPTLTFATKKDTWQKTVLQQKHDLNATQKYTQQNFVRMILMYKLIVDKPLKKQNIIHETVNIDNVS